jgi:hypothetical protein
LVDQKSSFCYNIAIVRRKEQEMKDKQRAAKLKMAIKKLEQAQVLINEALPETPYQSQILFDLHCSAVDLEQNFNYYKTGEVDPVR